jgi:NAD-dependent SIR2 family protein deacetylase
VDRELATRCTKCGEEKPRAEFSRDRSRKDGRAPWCKACVRRWQLENAERMTEYHRR